MLLLTVDFLCRTCACAWAEEGGGGRRRWQGGIFNFLQLAELRYTVFRTQALALHRLGSGFKSQLHHHIPATCPWVSHSLSEPRFLRM